MSNRTPQNKQTLISSCNDFLLLSEQKPREMRDLPLYSLLLLNWSQVSNIPIESTFNLTLAKDVIKKLLEHHLTGTEKGIYIYLESVQENKTDICRRKE